MFAALFGEGLLPQRGFQTRVGEEPVAMEEQFETDPTSPRVDLAHDTSVPVAHLAEVSSVCTLRERDASNSMGTQHDSMGSVDSEATITKQVSWSNEVELSIALTTLMKSKNAEPFLCDDCVHGLLGLHTIRKRLAEGRYLSSQMFWSDIDECLSICAPVGRHPFMVWEMRALFLQSQQNLREEGCLRTSLVLRSVAIPVVECTDNSERCYESGTRRYSRLPISNALHTVPITLPALEDRLSSTGSLLVDTVCDAFEANSPIIFAPCPCFESGTRRYSRSALRAVPSALQGLEDRLFSTGMLLVDMVCDARDEFWGDVLTTRWLTREV